MSILNFKRASKSSIFKSPRRNDPRLGDLVHQVPPNALYGKPQSYVLLGHPSDQGIRANFGRAGSRLGPAEIRRAFYRLTPGRKSWPELYDVGDIHVPENKFAHAQKQARKAVREIFELGHQVISLGGGHDHAYCDVGAFLDQAATRPLVINIDAHLDLRPTESGPNSGTPFFQLLEERPFDLVEIGIQPHSNSLDFVDYAKKKKVRIVGFHEAHGRMHEALRKIKGRKRPTFLSVDIDAFSSAWAPGCSAASPIGFDPTEFLSCMPLLVNNFDIRGLGVYEVSPPLDRDGMTSKLAALILHSFIFHKGPRPR